MTDEALKGSVAPTGAEPVAVLTYSTDDLPPERRYTDWRLRDWPRSTPIYRTEPTEPFETRWTSTMLGPIMFVHTEITAMRWERRLDDIRNSDFDPIIVSMMKRGAAHGDFDGRPFRETAGTFHFHDLGRPSLHTSTASETYNLVYPRALADEWFGPLDTLHGLVAPAADAAMTFAQAELTHRQLSMLDTVQAERLGRVFSELLAVALAAVRPRVSPGLRPAQALRQRAAELIEARLGSGAIEVEDLCKALNVARGRLFAAFKDDGGVRAFVTARRLQRAREALSELSRGEAVGVIAHRLGFSDAAHLSRAFRDRYGMTPSAYRHLLREDEKLLARNTDAERGF